jgi:hypothetical protein
MALRFDATATGRLNGVEYRVKIFDSRFSGTSTRLIDTENFVTVNLGETDNAGRGALRPREIDISLATAEDLSVITGAAEDDIRVELDRQDNGQTVFKGFIAPNQFSDRPLFDREVDQVRLTGSEGLNVLARYDASQIPTDGQGNATIQDVITGCLNQLYPTNLGIQVGLHWYEQGEDVFALGEEISIDAYRGNRPDGDFLNLKRVLEDTLRPFGFSIQQTVRPFGPTQADPANRDRALVWWISQWGAYQSDGTIEAWEFDPDQTVTTKRTEDVLVDLGSVGGAATIQPRHERAFERQLSSAEVTYSFPTLENYIGDGGLEDGLNSWDLLSPNVGSNDNSNFFFTTPDSFSKTPPETSKNQQVGVMQLDPPTSRAVYFFLRYSGSVVKPEETAAVKFEMQYFSEGSSKTQPLAKVNLGETTYLTTETVGVTADAPQNETLINVEPTPCPVPQGAKLPIQKTSDLFNDPNKSQGDFRDHVGFLTVEERAEEGSEVLRGSLNASIDFGDQVVLVRPDDGTGEPFVPLGPFRGYEQSQFGAVSFTAPFQQESGERALGGSFEVEIGVNIEEPISSIKNTVFDNVVLQPLQNGSAFSQVQSVAAELDEVGGTEEVRTRIGSGPSENTVSSIISSPFAVGENRDPINAFPLSELLARERLRYFRKPNKRLEVRLVQDDPLLGHEYVRLNGENFRVIATETTRTDGEYAVTLLQHKDYGTQ